MYNTFAQATGVKLLSMKLFSMKGKQKPVKNAPTKVIPMQKMAKFRAKKLKASPEKKMAAKKLKTAETYEEMNECLLALMDRPWEDLDEAERAEVLRQLPKLGTKLYRDFHRSMRENKSQIPDHFQTDF